MVPNTKRRQLLIGGGVAVAASAAGLGALYGAARGEDTIEAVLRRRLGPLKYQDADLRRFSQEYVIFRSSHRQQLRLLATLAGLYRVATPYPLLSMGSSLARLENNIVSNFLLATDFFDNGADLSRPLRYTGLHDPYLRPCRRIFAS